jgi:hypothetical protein
MAVDYLLSPANQGILAEVLPANHVNLPINQTNLAEVLN